MSKIVQIRIDGKVLDVEKGKYIIDVARENQIYIPTLCNIPGIKPRGSCRICTVRVNGRFMSSCTTPVTDGMDVENNTPEINELRKAIIELLYVEGNHFCPACEKSGNCELQALAYRFRMMVPRFPYMFPQRELDASHPKIIKEQNRCIQCKRCIRAIKDENGRSYFAFYKRGHHIKVILDPELAKTMTDEMAEKAMEVCPVGSILVREKGFTTPIGHRKFDTEPIGHDVEQQTQGDKA